MALRQLLRTPKPCSGPRKQYVQVSYAFNSTRLFYTYCFAPLPMLSNNCNYSCSVFNFSRREMGFQLLGDILDEGCGDKHDRITELPDGILSCVLSSLTARDAAKTSILSRRWICLYKSLPALNFDCCSMFAIPKDERHHCREHSHKFVNEVDKTLHLYLGPTVTSLRIAFGFEVEFAANIDRWLSYAVKMGVGKLDVNFVGFDPDINTVIKYKYNELYIFPFKLLSETSKINYLHLHSCILGLNFNTRINSLTALDLDSVILDQRDMRCIFSTCLNLEWLRLRRCRLPNDLFIRGPSLPLKFFMVDHCVGVKEIVLGAINLVTFEFYALSITKFCIGNVPKLERVFLSVQCSRSMTCILDKLERDVPQLTNLSILTSATVMQSMPTKVAALRNVQHLAFFLNLNGVECNLLKIIPILSACPLLQKLHLVMSCCVEDGETETETVDCSHHYMQLKEIEMGGFDGTSKQIAFAKHLLQNASVLERLIINPRYKFFLGDGKWACGGNSWDNEKHQLVRQELASAAQVIIR